MSARLSVFLFICLSVCLYVGQSSVCRLLCLLLSIHRSVYMSYCVLGRFEERLVVSGDNEVVAAKDEVPCFVECPGDGQGLAL